MRKIACRSLAAIVTFLLGVTCTPRASNDTAIPAAPHGGRYISEIRLQRQGCTDPSAECTKFDVTFYRDGTARYIGYENCPDFIGSYHASPNQFEFDRFVQLIESEGFFEMKAEYGTDWIDEKQTVTVVTNEGIKSVTTYNWIDTPTGLWAISGMLDYEVFEIGWDKDTGTR